MHLSNFLLDKFPATVAKSITIPGQNLKKYSQDISRRMQKVNFTNIKQYVWDRQMKKRKELIINDVITLGFLPVTVGLH